ncbi:MAG: hypothetical protein EHM28_11165 [Spirochaetaceae bacterium]|nr:MAG: hypothetical protein EHM28_11165 [Spirochaetaceae bacterium]
MKKIDKNAICLLLAVLMLFISSMAFCEEDIWRHLANTSWYCDNGWAGAGLVFYETTSGVKKAIHQIYGSGLPVVMSVIYDIRTDGNLILSAGTGEKLFECDFINGSISGISGGFVFAADTPNICANCPFDINKLLEDKIDQQTADCIRMTSF